MKIIYPVICLVTIGSFFSSAQAASKLDKWTLPEDDAWKQQIRQQASYYQKAEVSKKDQAAEKPEKQTSKIPEGKLTSPPFKGAE